MVLLAAAICTKSGKALVSRQFVEMTRSRIEGLLAAFPKLMNTGKQHTFVETESVRYVYQPLEKLYMLLITTKTSNILEDLETLRLFSRVIPEYCRAMEESEILDHSFELIFAFDEIVALGYRESVNLAQIRTFTEMDSHEEKVYQAVRESQEKEAKQKMQQRARELAKQRQEAMRSGKRGYGSGSGGGGGGGYGSSSSSGMSSMSSSMSIVTPEKPMESSKPIKSSATGKAMKLGKSTKSTDIFVDKLRLEGEEVTSNVSKSRQSSNVAKTVTPASKTEGIHLRVEEKMTVSTGRDGGLQALDVHGMITLRITDQKYGKIKIGIVNNDDKGAQLQTHPNVDKKLFASQSCIGMKNPDRPFPVNNDVGVLKWRFQSTDETLIPLLINCWPSPNNEGGCDVNIEYELLQEHMELQDVVINIPLPSGVGAPKVSEADGNYKHDSRHNMLEWSLQLIDASNKTGSMEFAIAGQPDDFFPITVNFISRKSFCDLQVEDVLSVESDQPVKFSSDVALLVDKYEVV
ncbi:coatomer subunit delta [Strongylocentrotus purpuratus]|uniref:Coatomer subunit delta n=1 Tax=Strongylocentrotus purpuratus TaxID=7668 RepID=A0A7M7RCC8_STRPU|nr:coatomer subunit delta [Strongylocentrotus purpuratus]|eukprot:XP_780010.1 PREDICTED: coatomer subunit delta [Strongylocentrotus purpuratus]